MEYFSSATGLLPEQIWDRPDRPEWHMNLGRPTGSAMPLMWAHAEYIKLLRSAKDQRVFDKFDAVADRYLENCQCEPLEIWKFNRQVKTSPRNFVLRILMQAPFRLRWSSDNWTNVVDTQCKGTSIGAYFVDLGPFMDDTLRVDFTFFWTETNSWEGRDFQVILE